MELELCLHPDDAARLSRLDVLAPLKRGKARSRPVRIIWHDSAGRDLAQQGMALAEHRSQWQLEALRPDSNHWPPGGRTPVLASASTLEQLGRTLPARLLPVAALEGRARAIGLLTEQGEINITLLNGEVRSVVGQQRVNRLALQGGAEPVRALALRLASEVRLGVPRTSLAAEAFAIATGVPAAPRREGPPGLPDGLSIAAAFAYVVGHLGDVIIQLAPSIADNGTRPEPVHQMRVAVRRLRSAIRVFRRAVGSPAIEATDASLKVLAAKLAPARDWDVFVTETAATVATAFGADKRMQRLLATADRRRSTCHQELRVFLVSTEFRRLGIELACLAASPDAVEAFGETEQQPASLADFAAQELARRCKKLNQIDGLAGLEPDALHAIRLNAKRLRYAAEIFAPLYPDKAVSRFIRRLSRLQDRLGALNDTVVSEALLAEMGGSHAFASGLVQGYVGARNAETREQIDKAWARFHRLEPFWLAQ